MYWVSRDAHHTISPGARPSCLATVVVIINAVIFSHLPASYITSIYIYLTKIAYDGIIPSHDSSSMTWAMAIASFSA